MVYGFWILLDCGGLTQPPPFRSTRFDMKNKKKFWLNQSLWIIRVNEQVVAKNN